MRPRLLVVADTGWEDGSTATLDAGGVDAALAEQPVELKLKMARGAGWPEAGEVASLRLVRLEDFSPDGVVAQVPRFERWAAARERLDACRRGELGEEEALADLPGEDEVPALAAALDDSSQQSSAAGPGGDAGGRSNGNGRLDELLGGVDLEAGGDAGGAAAGDAEGLADAAGRAVSDPEAAARHRRLGRAVSALDDALSAGVRAVLETPRFREVEGTWRGLARLAHQVSRAGGALEILASAKESFLETFFDNVFHREYGREIEEPLALVLCAYEFGNSAEDLEDLETAARFGESLSVPFLAHLETEFWGVKRPSLLAGLPDLRRQLDGAEYIKWRALKDEERSSWLFLTANRWLGRGTWGEEGGGRIRAFTFTAEPCTPLWLATSWLLAAVAGRAHGETGARLRLQDVALDDLPVSVQKPRRGAPYPYPLEVFFQDHRVEDLGWLGVTAPKAEKGSAAVTFDKVPSWHNPEVYDFDSATRASERAATLPQRVYAALVTHRFERLAATMEHPGDVEAWREQLLADLQPFYDADEEVGEQLTVELEEGVLFLRLRPDFSVGGGALDLVLSVGLEN